MRWRWFAGTDQGLHHVTRFLTAVLGLLGQLTLSLGPALAADDPDDRVGRIRALVAAAKWQPLAKGIDELLIKEPDVADMHVYRLAQSAVEMRVLEQTDPSGSPADQVGKAAKAVLVINGGFWWIRDDASLAPNGLLIVDGKKRAPSKKCSVCGGILYADKKGAHLERSGAAVPAKGTLAALQSGPVLVAPGGKVGIRKPGGPEAGRSAICLSGDSIYVFAIFNALAMQETARLLQAPSATGGFGCERAINLDGGTSTQVYVNLPRHKTMVGYPRPVQNFVAFFLK
jgi:uncharacterized protein YigE (DUF2233 family)